MVQGSGLVWHLAQGKHSMNMGGRDEKGINTPKPPLSLWGYNHPEKSEGTAYCFNLMNLHFCSWRCTKNPQESQGNFEVLVICQLRLKSVCM